MNSHSECDCKFLSLTESQLKSLPHVIGNVLGACGRALLAGGKSESLAVAAGGARAAGESAASGADDGCLPLGDFGVVGCGAGVGGAGAAGGASAARAACATSAFACGALAAGADCNGSTCHSGSSPFTAFCSL